MRAYATWLVVAFVFVAIPGCNQPQSVEPTSSSTPTQPPPETNPCAAYEEPKLHAATEFDGQNAFAYVLWQTCDFETEPPSPIYRIPGTLGRDRVASWLVDVLAGHGWNARLQNFTGAQYHDLDAGAVENHRDAGACASGPNRERVANLTFSNVVADRGSGQDLWLLVAHYDSKRHASQDADPQQRDDPILGANDGASGVAALLELARVIDWSPEDGAVRILLVDGEDGFEDCHPLAGSIYHARTLDESDRQRIQAVLVLDMVGDADPAFCLAGSADGVKAQLERAAQELGAQTFDGELPTCSVTDDHVPFLEEDLEALDWIDARNPGFPPYWHTTNDTPDQVSPATLQEVGRITVAAMQALISAD